MNSTLSKNSAEKIPGILSGMQNRLSYDSNMKDLLFNYIKILKQTKPIEKQIVLNPKILSSYGNRYFNSKNKARQASFLKSLEFIASRIPAQTLQSFMKMKCVGFTGSDKNVCYVSHWQTWLQGSDYDIDKAYIMGHNFDENGLYIGWSNLFDYSTLGSLKASEYLPMPKRLLYIEGTNGLDISEQLQSVIQIESNIKQLNNEIADLKKQLNDAKTNQSLSEDEIKIREDEISKRYDSIDLLRETKIRSYANVLNYIYKNIPENFDKKNKFELNFGSVEEEIKNEIFNNLNSHEHTEIPIHLRQGALRNFISSHIEGVISNIRNMPNAYTPISMDDLSDAAGNSPKGDAASKMTLMNPLVVYQMQYQNMVGKNVIGIAAVGEKASFMLHLSYNELVKSGERVRQFPEFDDRLRRSTVNFQTSRIIGRSKENVSEEELDTITTIDSFPGVNLEGVFDNRILNIFNPKSGKLPADLMISQVLSAATDNAKELILSKINAGEKLAKMYLFLISVGMDINDIVAFMINDVSSVIDELSEENIYDDFNISINDAIKLVKGNVPSGLIKAIKKTLFVVDNKTGKRIYFPDNSEEFSEENIRSLILTGNPL